MPDFAFGHLELAADLTVMEMAFAHTEDGQSSDLASLTEDADARWYQGAALSMVDAYDLADTIDECIDGRCSGARVALGLAPIIPGKAAIKLFNHFTPIERLVPIARKVSGEIDNMHWIPQQLHSRVQARWGSASSKLLNFTDPLAREFHRVVHGQYGDRALAYNARVAEWLENADAAASLDDFLSFIERLRLEYLERYSEYLTGG
jgi:hypothetical protein